MVIMSGCFALFVFVLFYVIPKKDSENLTFILKQSYSLGSSKKYLIFFLLLGPEAPSLKMLVFFVVVVMSS